MASQVRHQYAFACLACEPAGAASEPGRVLYLGPPQLPSTFSECLPFGIIFCELQVYLSSYFETVRQASVITFSTLEPFT